MILRQKMRIVLGSKKAYIETRGLDDTNSGVFDIETEDESHKCQNKDKIKKKRINESMEDTDKK